MARIVVFGGFGYAGGLIAAEAQKRGHEVVRLSRSHGGSIEDPAVVDEHVPGADVVVVSTPAAAAVASYDHLTEAAAAGGTRLGYVGGAGSLLVADGGPRLLDTPGFHEEWKPEATAHAGVLERLRSAPADLDWFYVSPAPLFGAWTTAPATGTYHLADDVLLDPEAMISGEDFALAFVDEIDTPQHRRRRFAVFP